MYADFSTVAMDTLSPLTERLLGRAITGQLRQHGVIGASIPVDLTTLLAPHHVTWQVRPLSSTMRGWLIPDFDGVTIYVNAHDNPATQRATIAHEWAHWILQHQPGTLPNAWLETEARIATAALLLPWEALQAHLPPTIPDASRTAFATWMHQEGEPIAQDAVVPPAVLADQLHFHGWMTEPQWTAWTHAMPVPVS